MGRVLAIAGAVTAAFVSAALIVWFLCVNGMAPKPIPDEGRALDAPPGKVAQGQSEIDWEEYPESVVAWIEVPGTSIDYPVVQGPAGDPSYYLTHDVWGGYDIYGVPYVSALCDEGLRSDNVIVYGHNMSDGSMFADFALFKWGDVAAEHSVVYLYEREGGIRHELHVVGTNVIDADTEEAQSEFSGKDELTAYLHAKLEESEVVMREPASISQMFTFVTCSYDYRNGRTLVYAIEEGGEADGLRFDS